MRLLLDTHALLWWWEGNRRLSTLARATIVDPLNETFASAAAAWEIATKVRLGKLPQAPRLCAQFHESMAEQGFLELGVSTRHALLAGNLPGAHGDPFDRILVAQAMFEDMAIITNDAKIKGLGASTIW